MGYRIPQPPQEALQKRIRGKTMPTPEKRKLLLIKHQRNLKDLVFPEPLEECCKKWSKAMALPMSKYLETPNDLVNAARMVDIVMFCPVCGRKVEDPFVISMYSMPNPIGSPTEIKGARAATRIVDDIITRRSYASSDMSSLSSDSANEEEEDRDIRRLEEVMRRQYTGPGDPGRFANRHDMHDHSIAERFGNYIARRFGRGDQEE